MKKKPTKKMHPHPCVFSLASNKNIQKSRFHEEISELCQSAGAAAVTPLWIIPRSGSGKWVNLGTAPEQLHILSWQPMEKPSASFSICFPIFNYLFWGDVTAPFHWGVAHFYLNYAFISKETIIYVATNDLRCSSLLINAALYLHFSFPAALIYLPVTNRPRGGNISPAAVL